MADVTGIPVPTGASPFRVPEDMKAMADRIGAPEMFSVATVSALPASDNWEGRTLTVLDEGVEYVWVGAWFPVGGKATLATLGSLSSGTVVDLEISAVGKRVTIEGRLYKLGGGTFATNELVAVIQTGFRPAKAEVFLATPVYTSAASWALSTAYITSDGSIRVNQTGVANAQIVGFNGSWRRP